MILQNNLHAIVFVTSDTACFTHAQFQTLLNDIITYNKANNIGELPVWANGNMLHFLEGSKEAVTAKDQILKTNPCLQGNIKLYDNPIKQRYFEDYHFAFKPINTEWFRPYDDFAEPAKKEFFNECLELDDTIMKIVKDFIKNNS